MKLHLLDLNLSRMNRSIYWLFAEFSPKRYKELIQRMQ